VKLRPLWSWGLLLVAVGLAALAYAQPSVMIQISEMIWSCFG
jgi:hypothetical protein